MSTVSFVAGELTFEWDSSKAASNERKHGVSFIEAATVFLDPLARLFDDPDHSDDEVRLLLVGISARRRALLVVHVERSEVLRIISARLATRRELAMLREED